MSSVTYMCAWQLGLVLYFQFAKWLIEAQGYNKGCGMCAWEMILLQKQSGDTTGSLLMHYGYTFVHGQLPCIDNDQVVGIHLRVSCTFQSEPFTQLWCNCSSSSPLLKEDRCMWLCSYECHSYSDHYSHFPTLWNMPHIKFWIRPWSVWLFVVKSCGGL